MFEDLRNDTIGPEGYRSPEVIRLGPIRQAAATLGSCLDDDDPDACTDPDF